MKKKTTTITKAKALPDFTTPGKHITAKELDQLHRIERLLRHLMQQSCYGDFLAECIGERYNQLHEILSPPQVDEDPNTPY